MTFADSTRMRRFIAERTLRELALFDSGLAKGLLGAAGAGLGFGHLMLGQRSRALSVLATVHRAALWGPADRAIERLFRGALQGGAVQASPGGRGEAGLRDAVRTYPDTVARQPHTARYFDDPASLLDGNMIVLKSPGHGERGVLYLYYSYIYPLFLRYFDAEAVARDYHIVLEPSWSGFCDPGILAFTRLSSTVFVGAVEPRDAAFIEGLGANLVAVPFGGNSWVDPRVFRPLPGVAKDVDIVILAGWASYKRHWAVFRALQRLRARGVHPRVLLVGYPLEMRKEDIREQARFYGVDDLIELHERVTPEAVNVLLNRSKVNLLWSRREGAPRAVIEGMFADVPCIVREGFNYGHRYAYVNEQTGRYATESTLPDVLADMLANHGRFSPHAWVSTRTGPEVTTAALNDTIRRHAVSAGERWTRDIVVKMNTLNGLTYWDEADAPRFADDYRRLRASVRGSSLGSGREM